MKDREKSNRGNQGHMPLSPPYRAVLLRIVLGYMVFGVFLIAASDTVLLSLVSDAKALMHISMVKGWVFVGLCAILVGRIAQTNLRRIHAQNGEIEDAYLELRTSAAQLQAANQRLMVSEQERREQYEAMLQYQQRLAESEQMRQILIQGADSGIWEIRGRQWSFNDRCLELLGYCREQLDRIDPLELIHPEACQAIIHKHQEHMRADVPDFAIEFRIRGSDGSYRWMYTRARTWYEQNSSEWITQGVNYDITDVRQMPHHKRQMGLDMLTGLPTTAMLGMDGMRAHLSPPYDKLALMQINVDNFRFYNQTYGYEFGDRLLREVAWQLGQMTQPQMTLYRRAGDNYLMTVPHCEGDGAVEALADAIVQALTRPIQIDGNLLYISVSIGIALYPDHGEEADLLLSRAEVAVGAAKLSAQERHIVTFSFPLMRQQIRRNRISVKLGTALKNNELFLCFQPQFCARSRRIIGLEALLRWNSPDLGPVPPDEFIPIAQQTQLILPIGTGCWIRLARLSAGCTGCWDAAILAFQSISACTSCCRAILFKRWPVSSAVMICRPERWSWKWWRAC